MIRKSSHNQVVDRFGFVRELLPRQDLLKENARLEKWREMLSQWDVYKSRRKSKLKRRIRKGIPDSLRGKLWYDLSQAQELKTRYPVGIYSALSLREDNCPNHEVIEVDLTRTFPRHSMFMEEAGRSCLRRVLRAYSFLDVEVGYCQGMAFIAATLLTYLEEEKAYWVLVSMLRNYNLKDLFTPDMKELHRQLFIAKKLLHKYMPKTSACMEAANLSTTFFATQWFMTLFSNSLPFECVVRIWDCFLFEGTKVTYRVFLAMIKLIKTRLKRLDFEKMVDLIKETTKTVEPDSLLKTAFSFSLSQQTITRFDKEYDRSLLELRENA